MSDLAQHLTAAPGGVTGETEQGGSQTSSPLGGMGGTGTGSALLQRKIQRRRRARAAGESGMPAIADPVVQKVPSGMSEQFGQSFDDVQIHTDAQAAAATQALGTEAVTQGRDIHFAPGAYAPETDHGKKVLGHELAHVVQQRDAPSSAPPQGFGVLVGEHGTDYEKEAARAGEAVAAGQRPVVTLRTSAAIAQRFDSYEHAALGDETDKAIGKAATPDGQNTVSDAENARINNDKNSAAGGGRFDAGQRGMNLELRTREPQTGLPLPAKQTVPVSYGEMVALSGDLYYSVDNLQKAPAEEVTRLRDLIAAQRQNPTAQNYDVAFERATAWRREGVYQPGTGKEEGTKGQYWGVQPDNNDKAATYTDLATENNAHFSAATGALATPGGPEGNAAADNHQAWVTDHSRAIELAKKAREIRKSIGLPPFNSPSPAAPQADPAGPAKDPKSAQPPAQAQSPTQAGGVSPQPAPAPNPAPASSPAAAGGDWQALENQAYIYNSGGDHYLTDAFSSGHLINKAALAPVTDSVMNPSAFDKIVQDLKPYAMKEPAVLGLSPNQLGYGAGALLGGLPGALVGHAIMEKVVTDKLRAGLGVFRTDDNLRHNVGAKLVHDYLNAAGANVTSRNGRFHWTTKGDDNMDGPTQDIASRAVLASRNYIRALIYEADADLAKPENADDAWEYTPSYDATAFTAMAAPWMTAQLKQTALLWALLKSALQVQDDQKKQAATEQKTADAAKQDQQGDWGQQPSNQRFTKRAIVTNDQP